MLFLPKHRASVTIMHSDWVFVPLSVMYIALLAQSWTPETLQLIMPGSLQAGLAGTHRQTCHCTICCSGLISSTHLKSEQQLTKQMRLLQASSTLSSCQSCQESSFCFLRPSLQHLCGCTSCPLTSLLPGLLICKVGVAQQSGLY